MIRFNSFVCDQMLARSLLLVSLLCAVAWTAVDAKNPGRTCRICEDVAQTYHDAYRCAGESVDQWGPGNLPTFPACEQPKFACEKLTGDISQACVSMETQFYDDEDSSRILWTSQMEFGKHYDTCVKLDKCEPDPNPEEKELSPCHQVFNSEEGKHDILNPGFTSNCTEECYLCNWLVKEWPLFQEICTPEGTHMMNSIDPDRTIFKENAQDSIDVLNNAKAIQAEADAAAEEVAQDEAEGDFAQEGASGDEASLLQRHDASRDYQSDQAMMAAARDRFARFAAQANANEGTDEQVYLETGAELKGMQRSWSRMGTRAIHGVLQAQRNTPVGNPGAGKNDLQYSLTPGEESDTDTEAGPQLTNEDMKKDCFAMWRYFARSRKAKFFASWKRQLGITITPADIQRSNNWDANVACKCLGQCQLDAFEHLGLIKQCRYDDADRTAMEYAYPLPH